MITDKQRLDWLEKHGMGIGLIHDDESHWIVAGSGMQQIRSTMKPGEMWGTTYLVDKADAKGFKRKLRVAVDYAIRQDRKWKRRRKVKR